MSRDSTSQNPKKKNRNRRKAQSKANRHSIPQMQRNEKKEWLEYMFEYRMDECFCPQLSEKPHHHRRPLKLVNNRCFNYSSHRCRAFNAGACTSGDTCVYSHGIIESSYHPMSYKTRICKLEVCHHQNCGYAHSDKEVRDLRAIFGVNYRSYNEPSAIEHAAVQVQECSKWQRQQAKLQQQICDLTNANKELTGQHRLVVKAFEEQLAKKDEEMNLFLEEIKSRKAEALSALSASQAEVDRLVLKQEEHAQSCPMLRKGYDASVQYVPISEVEDLIEENNELNEERGDLNKQLKEKDQLIEEMKMEIRNLAEQKDEHETLGANEIEFVPWFYTHFPVMPGNVWEEILVKCEENGLDSVSFWLKVVMREEIDPERNLEFSMERLFRTVLKMENPLGMRPLIDAMATEIKRLGVSGWLRGVLKLCDYDGFFEELGIMNVSTLLSADVDDALLKRARIVNAGHRVKILFYLSEMKKKQERQSPGAAREGRAEDRSLSIDVRTAGYIC